MEPTLPVAAFPPDLQYSLGYAFAHTSGRISVDQLELAVKRMLDLEQGRVPTHGFDLKLQAQLQVLEPDAEGGVPVERMEEALGALVQAEERALGWTAAYVLAGVIAVAMVTTLLSLVVELNRDMEAINGVFTDLRTGLPMQTASSDLAVDRRAGVLAARGAASPVPVTTRPFWGMQTLSSDTPREELAGLSLLTFPGNQIGLLIDGFAVIPKTRLSVSEKLVLFNTVLGTFVLDGRRLFPAGAGAYADYVDHATDALHQQGRRQVSSQIEVCGWCGCNSVESCMMLGFFWDP